MRLPCLRQLRPAVSIKTGYQPLIDCIFSNLARFSSRKRRSSKERADLFLVEIAITKPIRQLVNEHAVGFVVILQLDRQLTKALKAF